MLDVRNVTSQTRHHTLDPDTVIVEFEVEGISSYRDYWSPLAGQHDR